MIYEQAKQGVDGRQKIVYAGFKVVDKGQKCE